AGREKSEVWNHQYTGIESLAAIRLRERSHPRAEAALANLCVDSVSQRQDVGQDLSAFIPADSELLDRLRRSIKKHHGHDLRVCEMSPAAAHFPNAVVGTLPGVFHESQQIPEHWPAFPPLVEALLASEVPARDVLSIDVELELAGSGVAHTH